METPIETITGEIKVPVTLENKTTDTFTVRQILVGEYQAALRVFGNDIALVALSCGKEVKEIEALAPESYEALYEAVEKLNAKGFFVTAARQEKKGRAVMAEMPEIVEAGIQKFLSQLQSQTKPQPPK